MDAFAVSVCKGLKMKKINYNNMLMIAAFFGGFQAIMPFIGWLLRYSFNEYIDGISHWIAFILLSFIGGKMAFESFKKSDDDGCDRFDIKELLLLAVATSIDAMASGIAFPEMGVKTIYDVIFAVLVIGVITFVSSSFGVVIGQKFGSVYKSKAEFTGGIILILIGCKILFEHMGILGA